MQAIRQIFFIPHFIIFLLIKRKNRELIIKDINVIKYKTNVNKSFSQILVFNLSVNKYYRKMFYLRVGKVAKLVSWYSPGENTFFPSKNIGGGVYLAHPYSTILNAKSIGENFSCRQCTTIGNKIDGRNDLRPTIGNNVQLGANVVIIGDITIGDNVIIGAGSVVTKDVESNQVIAGNPAKTIKSNAI